MTDTDIKTLLSKLQEALNVLGEAWVELYRYKHDLIDVPALGSLVAKDAEEAQMHYDRALRRVNGLRAQRCNTSKPPVEVRQTMRNKYIPI